MAEQMSKAALAKRLAERESIQRAMGGSLFVTSDGKVTTIPFPGEEDDDQIVAIATGELWTGPVANFEGQERDAHGRFGHGGSEATRGRQMPKPPWFHGEHGETNYQAAMQLKALAEAGDVEGVKAHPGTPSPKLQEYRQTLLTEMGKPETKKSPTQVPGFKTKVSAPFFGEPPAPEFTKSKSVPEPSKDVYNKPSTELHEQLTAMRDHLVAKLDVTPNELRDAVTGDCSPKNAARCALRAKIEDAILTSGQPVKDAAIHLLSLQKEGTASARATEITQGDKAKSAKEYASTPVYDLNVLSAVTVQKGPVSGQAVCNMGSRSLTMGSTSVTGDYRHELGHAIRSAMGGASLSGKTAMTKEVAADFEDVQQRMKANPPNSSSKLSEEAMESAWGIISFRGKDNWEENCAEHYRGYHRAIYRDANEGGGGKHLTAYRERHPRWAKLWDAHYSAALLGAI